MKHDLPSYPGKIVGPDGNILVYYVMDDITHGVSLGQVLSADPD